MTDKNNQTFSKNYLNNTNKKSKPKTTTTLVWINKTKFSLRKL